MKFRATQYQVFLTFIFISLTQVLYAQQPTDCINAITVCGDSEINLDVNGIGFQELNGLNNCASRENNSLWLKVTLVTDGTLGFVLTPESNNIIEDYDFFVFGPNQDCNSLSQAIRCSTTNPQAANQGNNLTGMNSVESDTSEGPGDLGNSFVRWLTVSAGETYYIVIDRPVGNSPFNLEWTGTAEFASPPVNEVNSSESIDMEECDTDIPFDDEITSFDLSVNTNSIIGSQTNVTVIYFESESDANININQIIGLYSNTSNPQEVFAKITDDITGCFEIIPFNLSVNSGPSFLDPSDFSVCDNYNDGNATNGLVIFDLHSKDDEILNGQSASNVTVSYHETITFAQNGTNVLPNLYYNTDPNLQTIFVRIENISNSDCFSTTTLNLIVIPIPEAFNHSQAQCSSDNFGQFNLNDSNTILTGNISDRTTHFFTTINNAENSTTEIDNSGTFINTANPQTIYVQVVDNSTGCFRIAELILRVIDNSLNNAEILICDDDGLEDGFHTFDLTSVDSDILIGTPLGATISYYELLSDAYIHQNSVSSSFTNTNPYSQTIYARVENDNNCFGIAEIDLIINPLPDLESEGFVYYCLNTFPSTITIDSGTTSSTTNYTYDWSTGENTESININTPGIYTVNVTDLNNTCSKIKTITVEASNIATFESIQVIDASQNNTITVIVSGEGDYEYALFNEYGSYTPYQSSNTFNNVNPGIYTINVRDVKNNCGIVNDIVFVIGFPKFFTPNGDGDNDTWNIKGVSSIFQPNSKILIFDRFGKLIKQLNPLSNGWDGTFNGSQLPVSDYWFVITLQDGRIYRNHFTLKR